MYVLCEQIETEKRRGQVERAREDERETEQEQVNRWTGRLCEGDWTAQDTMSSHIISSLSWLGTQARTDVLKDASHCGSSSAMKRGTRPHSIYNIYSTLSSIVLVSGRCSMVSDR